MKMTAVLLLGLCLQLSARTYSQTVSLSVKNAALEKVFAAIQKQSGYSFYYKMEILVHARPVSIEVKNAPLEQVLSLVFKNQPFSYTIVDKNIGVKEKEPEKKEVVPNVNVQETSPLLPTVHGRITNEKGEPVAGVNISIKGGKVIGVTNDNGEFTLYNMPDNATLVFSAVSIETFETKLNARTELTLNVKTKVSVLDEVQMIAYGSTSKRLSTGNVSTVKATDIEKQIVQNPLLALQGRVPGVYINQATGIPGSGVTVRVQGQNSILAGNDPLIVIDGTPYPSQMLLSTTGGGGNGILQRSGPTSGYSQGGNGNPLNYINTDDIESITVLKDADATSIYGSRAANGAILITTKKGKAGRTKSDINMQYGLGKVAKHIEMLNSADYVMMRKEALKNDNIVISPTDANYDVNGLWDMTRYTDWQKELLGGTAHFTNINASVSGGNENVQYLVGTSYQRQTSVFPGSFADNRSSFHFGLNTSSKDQKFKMQVSGNYLFDNNDLPRTDITNQAFNLAPDAPPAFNANGTLNWAPNAAGNSTWNNPYGLLKNTYNVKTENLLGSAMLSYEILPGLEVKANLGYTKLNTNEVGRTLLASMGPQQQTNSSLRASQFTVSSINSFIIEPHLSWKKRFGIWHVEALIGSSVQSSRSDGVVLEGRGFITDNLTKDIRSASTTTVSNTIQSIYRYNALFGRLNLQLKNRYILSFNSRRDGSSRFGPNNRFQNFGSAAGAWIMSEEKFWKPVAKLVSFGKLKMSYGTSGNDQVGDYTYMDLYNSNALDVPYQNASGSLITSAIANPHLQWEQSKKFSVGADLGLFNDKLLVTASYGRTMTSNQLLTYALPSFAGFSFVNRNFPALVKNTSWEFTIASNDLKIGKLSWRSSFNLTIPKNELVRFDGIETSTLSNLMIGYPITIRKVYRYGGVNPSTGQYQFIGANGNLTSTPNVLTDLNTPVNTAPRIYGGLENGFTFKGVELSFLLQFVKNVMYNPFQFGNPANPPGISRVNQPTLVRDRWQRAGDNATVQQYNSDFAIFDQWSNATGSDVAYTDASFIRLKNLSISYSLHSRLIKKLHLEYMRIYIEGQNLFTLTKYKGLDPEMPTVSMPPLKMALLGVKLGF